MSLIEVNHPRISVIIPLYNKGPYIKRAIDSVLMQTVQDFEIIVVDGGSKDGGDYIVKGYTDSRIHFLRQKSTGVSGARNEGVEVSAADLVAFLDADDEWLPQFLEEIFELRYTFPNAGLYGTGYLIKSSKKNIEVRFEAAYGPHIIDNWFAKIMNFRWMIFAASAMVIPKYVFNNIGGFPLNYPQNEDRYLHARIALSYPIAYSPNIRSIYWIDSSISPEKRACYSKVVLKDPFFDYVSNNRNRLMNRGDYQDIVIFCERSLILICWANIFSRKDKKEIKHMILQISFNNFFIEKCLLLFSILFPSPLNYLLRAICSKVSLIRYSIP